MTAFTPAERNAIWEHAARAADDATAQIRLLAGSDPASAADAAWAAGDTLHVAAAALGSRILRQAADAYDRAARAPYGRIPRHQPGREQAAAGRQADLSLRVRQRRRSLGQITLITRLAALAEAVSVLHQAQQRAAQAASALTAARRLHAAADAHVAHARRERAPVHSAAAMAGRDSRCRAVRCRRAPPAPGARRPAPAGPRPSRRPGHSHDIDQPRRYTMDPSDHYPDPFGEALSYSSQRWRSWSRWPPPPSTVAAHGKH